MNGRSPSQLYALVIGATLIVAGIVGFFYSSSFGDPGKTDDVFGILTVNGWHNVVHIASGALGLLALSYAASRVYALGLAVVYTVVTIWGIIIGSGESILSIIPVNTEDTVLHAIIALAGFAAYAATPAVPAATRRDSSAGTATA
jgi:NAD/NADP transhydrogenase beta subunit